MVNIDKIKTLAKASGFKLGYLCELLGEDQNYFNKSTLSLPILSKTTRLYPVIPIYTRHYPAPLPTTS